MPSGVKDLIEMGPFLGRQERAYAQKFLTPPEIRLCLRAGSVYYFQERGLTSPEPHFFIVANQRPIEQQVLFVDDKTRSVLD